MTEITDEDREIAKKEILSHKRTMNHMLEQLDEFEELYPELGAGYILHDIEEHMKTYGETLEILVESAEWDRSPLLQAWGNIDTITYIFENKIIGPEDLTPEHHCTIGRCIGECRERLQASKELLNSIAEEEDHIIEKRAEIYAEEGEVFPEQ